MRAAVALIALLCLSVGPAAAAGIQPIALPGSDGAPPLVGAVWSPCAAPAGTVTLRRLEVAGVKDCPIAGPIAGQGLPLVVLSHGAGGWFGGHHDTAAALADAGYVVAAVTHPDRPGRAWQTGRPASVKALIDHMLSAWPGHDHLDATRIGFYGFSRGGYTGLVLIGAVPDFRLAARHCREIPDDPFCKPSRGSRDRSAPPVDAPPPVYTHDSRIRAAVIAAPLGVVFAPEGLATVEVPVQLWRPEQDAVARYPYHSEVVYRGLPVKPDYRVVEGAGHFAIMAPCPPRLAKAVPRICGDPPGFDRVAFHRKLNAEIVAFFDKHLGRR